MTKKTEKLPFAAPWRRDNGCLTRPSSIGPRAIVMPDTLKGRKGWAWCALPNGAKDLYLPAEGWKEKEQEAQDAADAVLRSAGVDLRDEHAPKIISLYACGTTWAHDVDPTNPGTLEFYTSAEAVLDNHNCASECGVVEVKAILERVAKEGKGIPLLELPERQRAQRAHAKAVSVLVAKLSSITDEYELKTQADALTMVLAGVKDLLRAERRKKRTENE